MLDLTFRCRSAHHQPRKGGAARRPRHGAQDARPGQLHDECCTHEHEMRGKQLWWQPRMPAFVQGFGGVPSGFFVRATSWAMVHIRCLFCAMQAARHATERAGYMQRWL